MNESAFIFTLFSISESLSLYMHIYLMVTSSYGFVEGAYLDTLFIPSH